MSEAKNDQVRTTVREHYAGVARTEPGAACAPGCCVGPAPEAARALGYAESEIAALPEGANLGLGCGNPQAIASLREGETVLDLGSGGGIDCFLAARAVGTGGKVIGVDMTPEMIARARENARKVGAGNVDFRLGEIENLPVADGTVDVVLSNCVINLSPEKGRVFREAARVLKPGGRLAIADVVLLRPLPDRFKDVAAALSGCVSGAATVAEIEQALGEAGFVDVQVTPRPESKLFIREWWPGSGAEDYVVSATIEGFKPGARKAANPEGEAEAAGTSCCGPSCCR